LVALFKLISIFRKEDIDLVHTHSSKAGILGRWAARLAGVPIVVHTIHGWGFHNRQNFLIRGFYVFLERITAGITDRLIIVSESDIEKGLNAGIARADKYTLIRYGIPMQKFTCCEFDIKKRKEELGIRTDSPVVGMVACLKPQKNILDFIKMASIVLKERPNVQFILVGDGILRKKAERLIELKGYKKNIILLGWRKDVDRIIPVFDIVVLTSLWEGLPIALLEAMACAKPIVAYNVDGTKEIVEDGVNGYLVKARDFEELSRKTTLLLGDKSLSRRMGEEGRNSLKNAPFNFVYMIKEVDKLYTQLFYQKKDHSTR
jgi:glycosyltransferase involved in cell wall biosynthesis